MTKESEPKGKKPRKREINTQDCLQTNLKSLTIVSTRNLVQFNLQTCVLLARKLLETVLVSQPLKAVVLFVLYFNLLIYLLFILQPKYNIGISMIVQMNIKLSFSVIKSYL